MDASMDTGTAVEMLVGLYVVDDQAYQSYRSAITPILEGYGGGIGYDFRVSEVLLTQTEAPINRLFTIHFPNRTAMASFFSRDDYLRIKQETFEKSVTHTTIIATYDHLEDK